jgi:hypothetical protein
VQCPCAALRVTHRKLFFCFSTPNKVEKRERKKQFGSAFPRPRSSRSHALRYFGFLSV